MKAFALLFGIIFLIIGIAGFIPTTASEGYLINILKVNVWLNLLHILTGIVALTLAWINRYVCKLYFQIIGILYAVLALLGFIYGDNEILGFIASNIYDTWFHVITSIAALILGYGGVE